MNLLTKFKEIYFNKESLSEEDMRVSRNLSIFEGCTARSILTLTSGAFLVGFAKYLGASDEKAGIIAAIPVLAGIVTVFSPIVIEKLESRKLLTCMLCFIGRLMMGLMILIPFISPYKTVRVQLLIWVFFIANLILAFTTPYAQTWLLNITPKRIRGDYYGKRESIVLGTVTVVTLIMGQVLDKFERMGQQFTGFIVLYAFVIVTAIINTVLFSKIKEPVNPVLKPGVSFKNLFSLPVKNKNFMKITFITLFWNLGYQIAFPFTSVYMVSILHLRYGLVTVMAVLASITSVVSVRFWGKIADKKSWLYIMKLMIVLQILSFLTWFFINPDTVYILMPVAHILGGAAISGVNISVNNLQYSYSPADNKTVYMGFSSAVNGIIGFLGTLAGSLFIKVMDTRGVSLGGFSIGNMQMLFLAAVIVLIVSMFGISKFKFSNSNI
ncbi:MFS transporter [Ruminiclostridium cellulolyticum]|uniref:MFS transporter n=1 Tax=Ruminiclostridium cellulolyticum TaxID=1521 RepID=UPI0005A01F34|nr:MFS transporter [Ruminiclostridium cellulolyticum]